MRTKIFQDVYSQYTDQNRTWLKNRVSILRTSGRSLLNENRDLVKRIPEGGKMYLFSYFPDIRNRRKLEYYDRFPLIISIGGTRTYFNGLNLHYLFPQMRESFIDNILRNGTDQRNVNKNLNEFLNRNKDSNPIMKRYLFSSCRSRFLEIPVEEWDLALALPVEEFRKKHKSIAWKDTREKLI